MSCFVVVNDEKQACAGGSVRFAPASMRAKEPLRGGEMRRSGSAPAGMRNGGNASALPDAPKGNFWPLVNM